MRIPVLVVTPTSGFGALIRQTLEDSGRYQVSLAASAHEALYLAGCTTFALSILDANEVVEADPLAESHGEENLPGGGGSYREAADLIPERSDITLIELNRALRRLSPAMRLIIVLPNNDMMHPVIDELQPDGFLTKPFYLPDLLDVIDAIMRTREIGASFPIESAEQVHSKVEQPDAPAWLTDVDRAAQSLARLSMESASQAALIVYRGELFAYAGELPQSAAQELARVVTQHWTRGGKSDLARFIHLEVTRKEYILYATRLGEMMVLALVFDIETPFSKIRSQASSLAHALASPPQSETNVSGPQPDEKQPPDQDLSSVQLPVNPFPLFEDVPPPQATGWGSVPTGQLAWESKINGNVQGIFDTRPEESASNPLAETRPTLVYQSSAESLSDGPEVLSDEMNDWGDLQSVSAAMCALNYACMLIPRLPHHYLTGELGTHLSEWATQLCLAFGWQLRHLAVRPEYLLWIVHVPPTVSPSYVVRMMRQHTTQRIFAQFSKLAQENPSGDFWAPGYLVMSSAQPPPMDVMHAFIRETRCRQGITKSPPSLGAI